ncbi:hypothetical protein [Pantanalinema sp. GBBB05]|uniref:hypothetical protein n=1 Tax=Pantanalinema sp. GBBB05 TaxID=2604139 RepID=UPI001D620F99|nr:hypothetical protein [Pantanalinema sp. GBBB05]
MAVTFGQEGLIVPKTLAADALMQLNLMSIFSKAALGGFREGEFEKGATVQFRRIKITDAEDYDPRGNTEANTTDPGYLVGDLSLENLFTNAVPVYSSDYQIEKYISEVGPQMAFSITKKFDLALYNKFRTPTHASTGNVSYGVNMPIRIVAAHKDTAFQPFNQDLLINAAAGLEEEDVPPGDLYAILATRAKAHYLGEMTPVDAGAVYANAGVAALLQQGFPIGQFVQRMGFMVGGSNIIGRHGSQAAVADLDTASSAQASLAIASITANTAFTKADYAGTQPVLGALDLVLTCTGLQNVAVGQIAKLGADNATATAFGVVLRVDAPNKTVTLVPFSLDGQQLSASDLSTSTDKFSIPKISSVNIAYKKQGLVFDTRKMAAPPENSGAQMVGAMDEQSGLLLQIWQGSYDVNRLRSTTRYTLLCGSKFVDYRMGCFMLSL